MKRICDHRLTHEALPSEQKQPHLTSRAQGGVDQSIVKRMREGVRCEKGRKVTAHVDLHVMTRAKGA